MRLLEKYCCYFERKLKISHLKMEFLQIIRLSQWPNFQNYLFLISFVHIYDPNSKSPN